MAVLHDRFGAFREEVKELLEKKQVRQRRASSLLPQHNSFLRAIHCGTECLMSSLCRALMVGHFGMRLCNSSLRTYA